MIPATPQICAGDILSVRDSNGKTFQTCVMQKVSNGQTDTLECSGSYRRDSSGAVNNLGFRALSGKVLNLRADVDGVKAENKDTQGKLAAFALDLEGIQSRVESQDSAVQGLYENISSLAQTAKNLTLELSAVRQDGAEKVKTTRGYTFDDGGLHILRSDSDVVNTLDHTGMYVKCGTEVMLQANNRGVIATDATVRNYLCIGHARFEDYSNGTDTQRTACYFV